MSSSNVMPSALPEQLYPELPPDNFRLSRICKNSEGNSRRNRKQQKIKVKIKKKAPIAMHYVAVGFGLSLGRSFGLWHCLEPYGSWNHS